MSTLTHVSRRWLDWKWRLGERLPWKRLERWLGQLERDLEDMRYELSDLRTELERETNDLRVELDRSLTD